MVKKKNRNKKKKKRIRVKILLLTALLIICAIAFHPSDTKPDTRVVAYLPSWSIECYKDVDMSELTNLVIAFANPDDSGSLSSGISDEVLKKVISKAHKHGVDVSIGIGGGSTSFDYASKISTKEGIKELNSEILSYVEKYDFDGVDIDLEMNSDSSLWDYYEDFISLLKKKCDKNNLILSCATASWFDKNISDETFSCFEFISIMAYDNTGASNPSSYDYAKNQLWYFSTQRDIPDEKLVLGVPFYGYRYENGVCTGKTVTYKEIATYNEGSQYVDESGTCRYNGIDTIKAKAELSKEYGGIMVWALGQDTNDKYSLLKAIYETLN